MNHIITPALKRCGYTQGPVRADGIASPGLITRQIVTHLIESDLVIADLSGHNPNVFYELALRHALKKPFVQMIHKGEDLPFD